MARAIRVHVVASCCKRKEKKKKLLQSVTCLGDLQAQDDKLLDGKNLHRAREADIIMLVMLLHVSLRGDSLRHPFYERKTQQRLTIQPRRMCTAMAQRRRHPRPFCMRLLLPE